MHHRPLPAATPSLRPPSTVSRWARPALWLAVGALFATAAACNEDDTTPPPRTVSDMYIGALDLPVDSPLTDGGADFRVIPDALDLMHGDGPAIQIIDPVDGYRVSIGAVLQIKAEVKARSGGGAAVDRNNVGVFLAGNAGALSLTNEDDIFAGSVSTDGLAPGDYTLQVYAADISGRLDFAEVNVSVGDGPEIRVIRPKVDERFRDQVVIEFDVIAHGANIASADVTAVTAGQDVQLSDEAIDDATVKYRGSVDLSMLAGITGPQTLLVTAIDGNNIETTVTVTYVIDVEGPVIDILRPLPATIYTNGLNILVNLTDGAGIQSDSVVAQLTNGSEPIDDVDGILIGPILLRAAPDVDAGGNGNYSADFDARRIPSYIQLPTIVVTARDRLGNESQRGYEFAVDDVGPLIDLDPPDVEIFDATRAPPLLDPTCVTQVSQAFDPVGNAIGDLPDVPALQVNHFTALIFDRGRIRPGARFSINAGIDPATVRLYILDDTRKPLAVDTNGDGICDDVNPEVVPTPGVPPQPGKALEIRMDPIEPGGAAQFRHETVSADGGPPTCDPDPPPGPLAVRSGDPLTLALRSPTGEPALWGPTPVNADRASVLALGQDVDTGNNIADGWACVAVAASDLVGNTGVSRPLRLCVCRDVNDCPACDFLPDTGSAPDCTGTAIPGMPVTSDACDSVRLPPGQQFPPP